MKTMQVFGVMVILIGQFLFCCNPNKMTFNCEDSTNQISITDQADSLMILAERIQNTSIRSKSEECSRMFFELFPQNYERFNQIYGYNSHEELAVLYHYSSEHIRNILFSINTIPENEFAKKLICISIGARWGADAIAYFQFHMRDRFEENISLYSKMLSQLPESDIYAFWKFYYDGPHPQNYEVDFNVLYPKIYSVDKKLAEFLNKAYNDLLSMDDGHGR